MPHQGATISFHEEASEFLAQRVLPQMIGLNFDVSYRNDQRRPDETVKLVRVETDWYGSITVKQWSETLMKADGPEYLLDLYGDAPGGFKVKTFTLL